MQIILISSRTLGASELLSFFCASLFSLTCFFPPVVCFLAVVVFEVHSPPPSPPLLHRCHSSPSVLLPSGFIAVPESHVSFIDEYPTWTYPL